MSGHCDEPQEPIIPESCPLCGLKFSRLPGDLFVCPQDHIWEGKTIPSGLRLQKPGTTVHKLAKIIQKLMTLTEVLTHGMQCVTEILSIEDDAGH